MIKQSKGITLIALVITIIIILILAGIAIQALTNTGLFTQASRAKKETQRAQVTEWLNLKLIEEQMNKPTGTAEEIIEATRAASDGNTELSKMGKDVVVDTNTSTIEDGEQVEVYFYVQVDEDVYKVDMTGAKFIGEKGKFPPVIIVENITNTTNSITIKVKTSRNEEGKIEFYIKKEGEAEYTSKYTAEGEEAKGLEYKFENLEQNKNYNIKIVATAKNGQVKEYTKDVTLGSVPAGEGLIAFSPVTWSNGEASTTISSTETGYTIQYQINSTTESEWRTGTNVTGLKHGDKLYARLWDGTNGGTTATNNILDGTDPSASISLSATSVGTTKSITATVTHTDNESGINIASCKWVYNTTSSAIGTDASYTGGTFSSNPQTITLSGTTSGTYYLHVLTTDVAGRTVETISNAVAVKVENSVAPSTATIHTAKAITYSWNELSTIAKMISNNSSITNDTLEVNVTLNGVENTLGVGDTATVDSKTVRILGFNHDTLTSSTAYGTTTATGKAGISFEYVTLLTSASMNSSNTTLGGWGASVLRSTLNSTTYNSLSIKNNIKQVQKEFIQTYNDASSKTKSSDYLWLLSCGEIWSSGYNGGVTRGDAIATEGSQYKYYKLGNPIYNSITDYTKKPNTSSASWWWLRSPSYNFSESFCFVHSYGYCTSYYAGTSSGVAPGFSI